MQTNSIFSVYPKSPFVLGMFVEFALGGFGVFVFFFFFFFMCFICTGNESQGDKCDVLAAILDAAQAGTRKPHAKHVFLANVPVLVVVEVFLSKVLYVAVNRAQWLAPRAGFQGGFLFTHPFQPDFM